jgi:hypothetical protein
MNNKLKPRFTLFIRKDGRRAHLWQVENLFLYCFSVPPTYVYTAGLLISARWISNKTDWGKSGPSIVRTISLIGLSSLFSPFRTRLIQTHTQKVCFVLFHFKMIINSSPPV